LRATVMRRLPRKRRALNAIFRPARKTIDHSMLQIALINPIGADLGNTARDDGRTETPDQPHNVLGNAE